MIQLLAKIEFHPERIFEPNVIIGLIVIIIGVLLNIFAKQIFDKTNKENKPTLSVITIKFIALAIVLIGCLIAVIKI